MAKLLSITSLFLLICVAPSFAQKVSTSQYLMLVRELDNENIAGPKPSLTLVQPDGSFTTVELPQLQNDGVPKKELKATLLQGRADSTGTWLRRARYLRNYVYQAEVKKLNELGAQGWVLVNTLQEGNTVRYLLRKDKLDQ